MERHLRLFSSLGVQSFCVVTGYRHRMLEEFFEARSAAEDITLMHNPAYERSNGLSLFQARSWAEEREQDRFFFTMADHFFSEEFLREASHQAPAQGVLSLAVDKPSETNRHIDLDDVTKVLGSDGKIESIGKHLTDYNYFDTGLFVASTEMFIHLQKTIDVGKESISDMVQALCAERLATYFEVSGHFWNDVDTPDDLQNMRKLF